ncbi:MAG: hypothetical protein U0787_17735 [Polyangia bacterium]
MSVDFASGMRRCVLAGCLSLLAHLLPAILLSSLSLLEKLLPPPPITWDIVPAKRKTPPPLIAPEAVAAKPLVPDPPEPAQKQQLSRRGEPGGKIGKPTPPKTPPLASLHGVGAASIEQDVGLRLVLRMAEVARSPHRQSVAGLLGAFPDSRLLVAGSALSSGDELAQELFSLSDVLVIATTDPTGYRRSATALLAMGKKLRPLFDKLTARRVPTWDDRELLFDAPDLLAFCRVPSRCQSRRRMAKTPTLLSGRNPSRPPSSRRCAGHCRNRGHRLSSRYSMCKAGCGSVAASRRRDTFSWRCLRTWTRKSTGDWWFHQRKKRPSFARRFCKWATSCAAIGASS